jgi:hypothetical protein
MAKVVRTGGYDQRVAQQRRVAEAGAAALESYVRAARKKRPGRFQFGFNVIAVTIGVLGLALTLVLGLASIFHLFS